LEWWCYDLKDISWYVQEIHKIRQLNWLDFDENEQKSLNRNFDSLKRQLESCLSTVMKREPLDRIIRLEMEQFFMPIDTMFKIYQRLLKIEPKDFSVFVDFADYLLLYGPDWEEEANDILMNVKSNDLQGMYRVALSVNYDKYNE
jgi:hypothetical protein